MNSRYSQYLAARCVSGALVLLMLFLGALSVSRLAAGVDAVSEATPGRASEPKTGEFEAQFVKWSRGKDKGQQALLLVVFRKDHGLRQLTVANEKSDKKKISPPEDVTALAAKLMIGDTVKVKYSQLGARRTLTAISRQESKSEDDANTPFTFVRSKKVRLDKQRRLVVTAKKGSVSWDFLVPQVEGKNGRPQPDPEIAQQVGKFRRNDKVLIDYEPRDFLFVIRDIRPNPVTGEGKLLQLLDKKIDGKLCRVAVVREGKNSLSLLAAVKSDDDAASKLLAALKKLQPDQVVTFTYHKLQGRLWLDEIAAVSSAGGSQ